MTTFLPGLELSRLFYTEAVRPILERHFPNLPHAAGLIGPGSEVLGFDTEMSMDHNWYPNVLIFLRDQDAALEEPIKEILAQHLPHEFRGFPVDTIPIPDEPGTFHLTRITAGPVQHRISPTTVRAFALEWLAWDIDRPMDAVSWLLIPAQILRSMTSGAVHHDGVGDLTRFRQNLAWYPHDIWLYLLASGWQRISEEDHLMPRAGFSGDELGSAIIGSRLVRDIMSLCFLMERQYAPYPKWFGSAFRQLQCAENMGPLLWPVLRAETWQDRESALVDVCRLLARLHNALNLTEVLAEEVSNFYGRPFRVIYAERFASAIQDRLTDPSVQAIARRGLVGNIDQVSDNATLKSNPGWQNLRGLYEEH